MEHRSHLSSPINRIAFRATLHCLTGCAIGEVLGMVIGTSQGWGNGPTVAISVLLAFAFGYAFTLVPLVRGGFTLAAALPLALAADTISIAVMEMIDNGVMLVVPGAMDAHVTSVHFWGSMGAALILAGAVAFPVNRWLIARGRGHAKVHEHHGAHPSEAPAPREARPAHHAHHHS